MQQLTGNRLIRLRQSCKGSSERVRATSEFQWSDRGERHGRQSRDG